MAYINGSKPFHYFNEWDPKTAAWLRELIKRGHLQEGIVDERSITEVAPEDLKGFAQHHFFAGIGGWPLALKLAGWPADAPVCTGSPPCQPFSVAGKRGGRDDSRHLAPAFLDLIAELRPPAIFGEQVSAAIKELWLDALFVELEEEGYTCASAVLPACSVGAPHKRDRLFFGAIDLADLVSDGLERRLRGWADKEWQIIRRPAGRGGAAGDMANGDDDRQQSGTRSGRGGECSRPGNDVGRRGSSRQLADTDKQHCDIGGRDTGDECREQRTQAQLSGCERSVFTANPHHGFWSDADWLGCRDGKFRPVEPGTFPLANGVSARVVRLRGYGNAIVPQVGAQFIRNFMVGTVDFLENV